MMTSEPEPEPQPEPKLSDWEYVVARMEAWQLGDYGKQADEPASED